MSRKTIKEIIKEEVDKFILKEFMQPSFNWDEFNEILLSCPFNSTEKLKKYCNKTLGEPIGNGYGRTVYEIDDYTVLKISNTKIDTSQNEHEYEVYEKFKHNPLLPKIYGHADDFSWLWSERVLPCTHEDFKKILGIPFYAPIKSLSFDNFLDLYSMYKYNNQYFIKNQENFQRFKEYLKIPWLKLFLELIDSDLIELSDIIDDNIGIALRDGNPTIIILDTGV